MGGIGGPCRGERWGCQPSLSNRRAGFGGAQTRMPAAAQGAKPPRPIEVFWSRINVLSEDAEIMDQESAALFGHTINDLRRQAQQSAHESSRRRVAGKSHFEDFRRDRWHKSQFHRPWRQQFRAWNPQAAGLGGLGHVDHLVCGDGGIAEGHGTRAESGAGEDRRRPHTLYRHLSSTGLPAHLAPPSGAEIRPSRRLQQRHQGAAVAFQPSRQLEFEQNDAHDRG